MKEGTENMGQQKIAGFRRKKHGQRRKQRGRGRAAAQEFMNFGIKESGRGKEYVHGVVSNCRSELLAVGTGGGGGPLRGGSGRRRRSKTYAER
jgi:hypothetical protein